MDKPRVSVIVPNYNHAPYLRQRLDSIFNQTYQDFEVIILDDCSTDNSREIIEEYRSHPQISHIVYNETNSGSPFKQWAKGFKLAQGEYIWIAESDDWAEPDFLKQNIYFFSQDQTLSLVFCNSFIEDGTKQGLSRNTFNCSKKIDSKDILHNYMCWNNVVYNASSVLFLKKIALQINPIYQKYVSSGDYLFWIFLIEKGNVFYNFKSLNHYRIHEKNTSIVKKKQGRAHIEDLEIYKYLKHSGYTTFIKRNAIVLNHLQQIMESSTLHCCNSELEKAYQLWRKEILSIKLSKFIDNVSILFWKILKKNK